jgi:hypothetical protein
VSSKHVAKRSNATFASNSSLVPNLSVDTDGRYTASGGNLNLGYLATVKGRPSKVCGLSGATTARVADCATQNGSTAIWEGAKYGQNGEADWKLVTLYAAGTCSDGNSLSQGTCVANSGTWTAGGSEGASCTGGAGSGCFEVWQDQRTQLIWSDAMTNGTGYGTCSVGTANPPQYLTQGSCTGAGGTWKPGWTNHGYNWFQADGYSSTTSTVAVTGYEGQALGRIVRTQAAPLMSAPQKVA